MVSSTLAALWRYRAAIGATYGRSEGYTGMSIPGFGEGLRGIGGTRSLADTPALLMLLLEDPLVELADRRTLRIPA